MYTILSHALPLDATGEGNESPRARAEDFPGRLEFVRNPEAARTSQPLTYYVDGKRPLPDYMAVVNVIGGKLCSYHFLDVLARESADFTAYPAQLADSETCTPVKVPHASYYLWTPRRIPNVIDWQRSRVQTSLETGQRYLLSIVLIPECEASGYPLFQPAEKLIHLVHARLRTRLESAGVTGIEFLPLDVVHDLGTGHEKLLLKRRLGDAPDNAHLWTELGGVLQRLRQDDEALAAFERALQLQPSLGGAQYGRGLVLTSLQRYAGAADAFSEATRLESSGQAWIGYSAALHCAGQLESALSAAERATQVAGEMAGAWQRLGEAYAALGQHEAALLPQPRSRRHQRRHQRRHRQLGKASPVARRVRHGRAW